MSNIEENAEQMNEPSPHSRKRRRLGRKNRRRNFAVKNALHEKRIVEEKLREALEKNEMEVKHSDKLEKDIAKLRYKVFRLHLKLKQKDQLCKDAKVRLAIHSETASLACRQVRDGNKRLAELIDECKRLQTEYTSACVELNNLRRFNNEMEMELNRIKLENLRHGAEVQRLKQVMEFEMTSLVRILDQNHNLLLQKTDLLNWLVYENIKNRKRVEELEGLKQTLEEEIRSTNAVLQAQHQELQVYETNQKIREKGLLQNNHQFTANFAAQNTGQFQQGTPMNSVCNDPNCHNRVMFTLERIDVSNFFSSFFLSFYLSPSFTLFLI